MPVLECGQTRFSLRGPMYAAEFHHLESQSYVALELLALMALGTVVAGVVLLVWYVKSRRSE